MGFSVRATRAMVEIISSEKYNRESNMLEFARSLGALAAPICESIGTTVVESALDRAAQDQLYLHLTNIEAGSKEQAVKQAVETIILNKSGPAGNTTQHFIDKFRKDAAAAAAMSSTEQAGELVEVRHFIDGMHEYLLESHIAELVAVLLGQGQGGASRSNSTGGGSDSGRSSSSAMVGARGGADVLALTSVGCSEGGSGSSELAQDDVVLVSYLVFVVVEEVVFFPLQDVMSAQFYADEKVLVS